MIRLGRRPEVAPRRGELPPLAGFRLPGRHRTIAALAYRGVTTAELDDPVSRLAHRLDANVVIVGPDVGPVHGVEPTRRVIVDATPADAPVVDVLVVPGGLGWKQVAAAPDLSAWLADAAATARGILAMSTGSLLLASVGRLAGKDATGHWLAERELAELGANVQSVRSAHDETGRVVTAAGALAAMAVIDMIVDATLWAR